MYKKTLLLLSVITVALFSKAQPPTVSNLKIDEDQNKIYTFVQQQPEYPGGFQALQQFIKTRVHYPDPANITDVPLPAEARYILVEVRFVVERDGSVTDVKAVPGISASLAAEAARMVRTMPYWQPGLQDDKPVRTFYSVSINFGLKDHSADLSGSSFVNNGVPIVISKKSDDLTGNDPSRRVYTAVEEVPEFPGGLDAFYKFLGANTHYPQDAKDNKKQGRVIISFVVEKDGTLTDVTVVRSVFPSIDAEALRVIRSSPKWKPGIQNGRPVRVQYSVPINFTL